MKKLLFFIAIFSVVFTVGCKKASTPTPADPAAEVNAKLTAFVKKLESGSGKWLLTGTSGYMYDADGKITGSYSGSVTDNSKVTWMFTHYNELNFEKLIYESTGNAVAPETYSQDWTLKLEDNKFRLIYPYWSYFVDSTFENVTEMSFDLIEDKPVTAGPYYSVIRHFKKLQ